MQELAEVAKLSVHARERLELIRSRHPDKRSVCGTLLAECSSGETLSDRTDASIIFGLLECRRGLRSLVRILDRADQQHTASAAGPVMTRSDDCGEMTFLNRLLFAIGKMDTPSSHAELVRVASTFNEPSLRASALEAMAFERTNFDAAFITKFLTSPAHLEEILSALYSLDYQGCIFKCPDHVRRVVAPMLRHGEPRVRTMAIRTLSLDPRNLKLIEGLGGDTSGEVRQSVAEALNLIASFDEHF